METLQGRLILGSSNVFDRLFLLNPENLTYEVSSRSVLGLDANALNGLASLKEGDFSAFYKYQNSLWAAFGSSVYPVTDALTSHWSTEEWKPATEGARNPLPILKPKPPVSCRRNFKLVHNGTVVEERNYSIVENDPDTRLFVIWDNEDEDFLLWMHNMLHSSERKHLAMENWK